MTMHRRSPVRASAAAVLAAAGLGLAGCAAEEPAGDTDTGSEELLTEGPAEPYSGPYDGEFVAALTDYVDQEVVLTGEVGEIVSPVAFTVAGPEGGGAPPLLVVHDPEAAAVEPGATVEVTGTLREAYNVPTVEEEAGAEPVDDGLAAYDGQPYVQATAVDVAATGEGSPAA